MNSMINPEQHDHDWQIEGIEKHVEKQVPNTGDTKMFYKVIWFGGKKQWLTQDDLRLHDPHLVIRHAVKHNLLGKPGFEWISHHLDSDAELATMLHAYKVALDRPKIKFGSVVPTSTKHAYELDTIQGTIAWKEAIKAEIDQINAHETFIVLQDGEPIPPGYKRIPYHCVYDMKFDGRKKCRLVAGGHCTDPPKEDNYSGVVSMEIVRTCFILAHMNDLQICAGDISNAFLYGKT